MKIRVLGSLSGTEPFPNRNHTSWVLELDNGSVYWFDAGENCSRTAYLAAVDILNVKDIFISHPHYDHLGGLMNVFTVMRKMRSLDGDQLPRTVNLHLPIAEMVEPFDKLMKTVDAYPLYTEVKIDTLYDGMVFDNGEIKVEIRGNKHIAPAEDGTFKAFSFRITAQDKVIVYSGDIKEIRELDPWTGKCDLLLMENAHYDPRVICKYLAEKGSEIGRLVFLHHGRSTMKDPEGTQKDCRSLISCPVDVAFDIMTFEL